MGDDLDVVNAARVSFSKESDWANDYLQELSDKDKKLISYLGKHEHYSPFGHCFASFHVKAPIFVARQCVKHEYLRFNEVSRRYVTSDPEFWAPNQFREAAADKKQGSGDLMPQDHDINRMVDDTLLKILDCYDTLLARGVCPEQARSILPVSTYTEWVWSGSLDAFANMYNLRNKPDSQEETRIVAQQIGKQLEELFPESWKALTNAH